MLNQVILVGIVSHSVEPETVGLGCFQAIVLSIGEGFENQVTIFISERLYNEFHSFVEVGMTLGVKAKLVNNDSQIEVHADKITFINSLYDS